MLNDAVVGAIHDAVVKEENRLIPLMAEYKSTTKELLANRSTMLAMQIKLKELSAGLGDDPVHAPTHNRAQNLVTIIDALLHETRKEENES